MMTKKTSREFKSLFAGSGIKNAGRSVAEQRFAYSRRKKEAAGSATSPPPDRWNERALSLSVDQLPRVELIPGDDSPS
jgi:hypothetical protein